MNAPITQAHRLLAAQIGANSSAIPITPDGEAACSQMIADFCMSEMAELKASMQAQIDVRGEMRDEAIQEMNAALARAERAESEWTVQAALVKASVDRERATAAQLATLKRQLET